MTVPQQQALSTVTPTTKSKNQQASSASILEPAPAAANPQGKQKDDADYPDANPDPIDTDGNANNPDPTTNSESTVQKPFSGVAIESMSAQEIWNMAKPSVSNNQSGRMFRQRTKVKRKMDAVSYTHLTLPTICSV